MKNGIVPFFFFLFHFHFHLFPTFSLSFGRKTGVRRVEGGKKRKKQKNNPTLTLITISHFVTSSTLQHISNWNRCFFCHDVRNVVFHVLLLFSYLFKAFFCF